MVDNEKKFWIFIIGCLVLFAALVFFFQIVVPKVEEGMKRVQIIEYGHWESHPVAFFIKTLTKDL